MVIARIKSFISGVNHNVLAFIGKVSPYVLQQMKPILTTAAEDLWKTAMPLALPIIKSVATQGFKGFDAHSAAVKQLETAVVAVLKRSLDVTEKLHLGQIVLTAYANSPEILKILATVASVAAIAL